MQTMRELCEHKIKFIGGEQQLDVFEGKSASVIIYGRLFLHGAAVSAEEFAAYVVEKSADFTTIYLQLSGKFVVLYSDCSTNRVTLFNDAMGMQPCYFTSQKNVLYVSPSLKQLKIVSSLKALFNSFSALYRLIKVTQEINNKGNTISDEKSPVKLNFRFSFDLKLYLKMTIKMAKIKPYIPNSLKISESFIVFPKYLNSLATKPINEPNIIGVITVPLISFFKSDFFPFRTSISLIIFRIIKKKPTKAKIPRNDFLSMKRINNIIPNIIPIAI